MVYAAYYLRYAKIIASWVQVESCDINQKTAWVIHLSRGLLGMGTRKW